MIIFIEKEPSIVGNSFLRPDLTQITMEKVLPNFSFQKMLFFTNCKRFSDIARARRECSRHLKRCQCVPTFWFSSLTSPPATPCLPYSLSNATIDPYLHTRPLAVTPEPDCPPKRIITASQTGGNRILLL